jgi:hypothetical protein
MPLEVLARPPKTRPPRVLPKKKLLPDSPLPAHLTEQDDPNLPFLAVKIEISQPTSSTKFMDVVTSQTVLNILHSTLARHH